MRWTKSFDGWVSGDWKVRRAPSFNRPLFWLYYRHARFTPTGRYDDAVSFPTAAAAKDFARAMAARKEAQ